MPNIAPITVKKADGTTDVTYDDVQPASGTSQPAIWRSPIGDAPAHKAELRVRAQANKLGTVRRVEGTLVAPQVVTAPDGSKSVTNRVIVSFTASVPQAMSQTEINEAIAQAFGLFNSSLIKSSVTSGFAPT